MFPDIAPLKAAGAGAPKELPPGWVVAQPAHAGDATTSRKDPIYRGPNKMRVRSVAHAWRWHEIFTQAQTVDAAGSTPAAPSLKPPSSPPPPPRAWRESAGRAKNLDAAEALLMLHSPDITPPNINRSRAARPAAVTVAAVEALAEREGLALLRGNTKTGYKYVTWKDTCSRPFQVRLWHSVEKQFYTGAYATAAEAAYAVARHFGREQVAQMQVAAAVESAKRAMTFAEEELKKRARQ